MASDQNSLNKYRSHANSTTIFSQPRRKISFRRRKKLPVVQLGAGETKRRRRSFLVRIFRRVRLLKRLKLQYLRMVQKIKEYYWSAVNDILENQEAIDAYQRRLQLETSFAIPLFGLSLTTFPNRRPI